MAAVSEPAENDSDSVQRILNHWLLDYVTYSAWEEFSAKRTVEEIVDRDFITGVINKQTEDKQDNDNDKRWAEILTPLIQM